MKKKLLLLFAVLATAVNASAIRIVRDGITYSILEGTTCAVIKGDNVYSGDIIISSTVTSDEGTTYTVVSIADNAFKDCSDLTSVVIPETVTSIGYEAFYQSGLVSVVIPESVISIGSEAFQYCTKLTSVTIPNSVSSIVSYTFKGCSNLTSVVIGNSVTSIGNYAFKECSSLTSLVIGNSVSSIGEEAFFDYLP